ncbi:uncharacterized protein Z518_01921 [Rhinocladiella mackenziei CBS 650.93]|uniref:Uncharacterized protein n=1 Tax=Rhinocladiella mackenziei CBS 650.93 TaxID=1442369 RepID=A0A0D2H9U7_9EURO|nr:uncharacterized protein Z518_01921 [Rhinocladiella mackenziei CBS 650.93]KIX07268.1 hypothetical protein Z518_01921 [Rhinocladiella mackenziei CBS 650.93]
MLIPYVLSTLSIQSPQSGSGLPVPIEDIDQVRRDMRGSGYGLVKDALSKEQVEILGGPTAPTNELGL